MSCRGLVSFIFSTPPNAPIVLVLYKYDTPGQLINVRKCKNMVILCVSVTHTYRRPKKLVLLSEVPDAGLGTLSLPKESCDLQEILLTLDSIAIECLVRMNVSDLFRERSSIITRWTVDKLVAL